MNYVHLPDFRACGMQVESLQPFLTVPPHISIAFCMYVMALNALFLMIVQSYLCIGCVAVTARKQKRQINIFAFFIQSI